MKKIVKCDTDIVFKELPNITQKIFEVFGSDPVALYAFYDDEVDKLGFIVRRGPFGMYLDFLQKFTFILNDQEELESVLFSDRAYKFDDQKVYMLDYDRNIESSLSFVNIDDKDEDAPEVLVSFVQYSGDTDTMCTLRYRHVYRHFGERPRIYNFHLDHIDSVYIDEKYVQKGTKNSMGFLPQRCKYFARYEFDSDQIGYNLIAIKDYGLIPFLMKGPYNLIGDDKVSRFVKMNFIDANGDYRDFFPFTKVTTEEEMIEFIRKHKLLSSIPQEFIDIYNNSEPLIKSLKELISETKKINLENDDTKRLLYRVVEK